MTADAVTEKFSLPKDKRRHQPIYQPHPIYVEHKIRLTDSGGWSFENDTFKVENDYFSYTRSRQISGTTIAIDFTAKTYESSVAVKESRQYIRDLSKLLDYSYFYTTYNEAPMTNLDRQLYSIGHWFSETSDKLAEQSAGTSSH